MSHAGSEMTGTGQLVYRSGRADGRLVSVDGPTRAVVPADHLPRRHGLFRDLERPADVFSYLGVPSLRSRPCLTESGPLWLRSQLRRPAAVPGCLRAWSDSLGAARPV